MIYTRGFRIVLAAVLAIAALGAWRWIRVRADDRARYEAAVARAERVIGSLDLESYRQPEVPAEENAAERIREAIRKSTLQRGLAEADRKNGDIWRCTDGELPTEDPENLARMRSILAENRDALDALRSLRAHDRVRSELDDVAPQSKSDVGRMIAEVQLSRLLTCDSRLALLDGRLEDAIADVEAGFAVDRTHQGQGLLLAGAGDGFADGALVRTRELLAGSEIDLEGLSRLRRAIPENDAFRDWRHGVAWELAESRRLIEGILVDDSSMIPPELAELRPIAKWQYPLGAALLNAQCGFVEAMSRSRQSGELFLTLVEEIHHAPWDRAMDPTWSLHFFDRLATTATLRNLARRAVELRLEAMRTGVYPETLNPPSTAADDPLSGEPFAYTRLWDGGALIEALPARTIAENARRRRAIEDWSWRLPPPPKRN